MPSTMPQVACYVLPAVKEELASLAEADRRSISFLVSEAVEIALPELRRKYGKVFTEPVQVKSHGHRKHRDRRAA